MGRFYRAEAERAEVKAREARELAHRTGYDVGWAAATTEAVHVGRFNHVGRERGSYEAARGRVAVAKREGCAGCLYGAAGNRPGRAMECRRQSVSRCREGAFPRVDVTDWCGDFVSRRGKLIPEDFA